MHSLHRAEKVFSLRHLPSWLLLCFAAGSINGTALLACERFVTHVTGTVTRLGMEIVHWNILVDFALVLISFILGAMISGLLINGRAERGRTPYFALPLWLAAAVTASVGAAGHLRWFGPFGGSVDEPLDFVMLCCLSFGMGLQNAGVATSTGMLVRTTHLTGPATDLGLSLAELLALRGERRHAARRHALLRAGKILAFAAGAASAVFLGRSLEYLAFTIPAAVIVLATLLSFMPRPAAAPTSIPAARPT